MTQPEALGYAVSLEARGFVAEAAELRRLHEENQTLRQALAEPEQDTLGSEWVPCVKLPVIVHVRNQREGETHISTREGITPVLPEDLIMRGVAGEEYPIGRELFERTYTFDTAPPSIEAAVLAEREKVARWMIERSYATGHGDTIEDLLAELEWQVAEQEREACAKLVESFEGPHRYVDDIAAAIRARSEK